MGPSGLQSHVPLYRGRTHVPQAIPVADKYKDDWWRHIVYVNNVVGTHGNDAFNQVIYGS